ncbi:MAG: DUF6304 family protein [Propionibacteriaceae bacterium]|nr:DUF6304 family protein [Propionibacteriaceae bacterium]
MCAELVSGLGMEYPLVYTDEFGTVKTSCHSDGHGFMFQLRGRTFRGQSFDCLYVDGCEMADLPPQEFSVKKIWSEHNNCYDGDLEGKFTITLPLRILGATEPAGKLMLSFDHRNNYVVDGILTLDGVTYTQTSQAGYGYVEDVLIGLECQLPAGVLLACCLTCRWSHFHPLGYGCIGYLGCLVDWPSAATISSDTDVEWAWHYAQEQNQFQYAQETWQCPRFQLVQPGEFGYLDYAYHRFDPKHPRSPTRSNP